MNPPAGRNNRLVTWLFICGLLCLTLAQPAQATDAIWPPPDQQGAFFDFTVPGSPPPSIDATIFDNEGTFIINFEAISLYNNQVNPEIYETANTLYYTNNGLMVATSPLSTNGIFLLQAPGCGFLFDTQTTNVIPRQMAGTVFNAGDIRINSVADTATNFFNLFTVGRFTAWATNIVNPGTVTVGANSLIQFTGKDVDLTRGQLTVEGINTFFISQGFLTGFGFNTGLSSLDYGVGTDTNGDWDPSLFLQPNFAISSEFNSLQFPKPGFNQMVVNPSLPYFSQNAIATNYILTRAVFLNSNPGQGVNQNVFFGGNPNPNLGPGFVTIEWSGAYVDPATGQTVTNYLYLNDFYLRGANTNNPVFNGVPSNFTFTELNAPAFFSTPPAASSYPPFVPGVVTNNYSYVDVQLIPSSVATNAGLSNPSGALTNLVGRIQINASHDLDLTLAQMSGQNYTSIIATNHFEGSSGASIFSPYSDIYLGVTNGYLSISNLLAPKLPHWSGTVQAWSSDWINVDTNGVTNEFRVLLVNPNLVPFTPPVVQDLTVHSTNTVISDTFNIIRKLFIDATSLTLTTNLNTDGFGSQDGELNWYGTTALNTVQFPNLHWLTNNGAIRAGNLAVFGSSASPYGAIINHGLLVDLGSTLFASNFLSSGTVSNGTGAFLAQAFTTTLTNGSITAGGNISLTTSTLLTSNLFLSAGKALTLTVSNQMTDSEATNGNFWDLGLQAPNGSPGVYFNNGFNLPIFPTNRAAGDLHQTTVTSTALTGKRINNLWAAQDRGATIVGFSNNVAVGRLILDALGKAPATQFYFSGIATNGMTNAMYVDEIDFRDFATNTDINGNITNLNFNTNIVIYYAQATFPGFSVASKLNHKNGDHLRWVPAYAGVFSSTNLVYPPGVTNTVNAALAQDPVIDSDGDGTPNGSDPTPFFTPAQMNFTAVATNVPPLKMRLQWDSIPAATNSVLYKTNLLSANWLILTNFVSPTNIPPSGGWPLTNTVYDTVNPLLQKYYRVRLDPNSTNAYGP